jgi:hypothetical protein
MPTLPNKLARLICPLHKKHSIKIAAGAEAFPPKPRFVRRGELCAFNKTLKARRKKRRAR